MIIAAFTWDYYICTFHEWDHKYLWLVRGHNCFFGMECSRAGTFDCYFSFLQLLVPLTCFWLFAWHTTPATVASPTHYDCFMKSKVGREWPFLLIGCSIWAMFVTVESWNMFLSNSRHSTTLVKVNIVYTSKTMCLINGLRRCFVPACLQYFKGNKQPAIPAMTYMVSPGAVALGALPARGGNRPGYVGWEFARTRGRASIHCPFIPYIMPVHTCTI